MYSEGKRCNFPGMRTIVILSVLLYMKVTADIFARGPEGTEISFRCFRDTTQDLGKYFCKDPCFNKTDILASVEPGGQTAAGRISLVDTSDGGFNVTFSDVQKTDSGLYYCYFKTFFYHKYITVRMTVGDDSAVTTATTTEARSSVSSAGTTTRKTTPKSLLTTPKSVLTTPKSVLTTSTGRSTVATRHEEGREGTGTGVTVSVTVVTVAVVAVVLLLLLFLHRRHRKRRAQSMPLSNTPGRDVSAEQEVS